MAVAELPLGGYRQFDTQIWQVVMVGINLMWRGCRLERLASGDPNFELNGVSLEWMSVAAMKFGTPVFSDVGEFEAYAIFVPITGECRIRSNDDQIIARRGHIGVLSAGTHVRTWWSSDCEMLIFKFDAPGLEGRAGELLGRPLDGPLRFKLGMDTGDGPGWFFEHEVLWPIVGMLERGSEPLMDEERPVMDWLLKIQPHNYRRTP
ncbi:cupin domain-containing protein [Phytoactinopolyspora endophytica]|uniref:cupin domain-containing protein n=1 Tax=Phytoactinopolyspora endophytica TaxID=1642495 RepID=UPI00101BDCDA|nr:hypothetical protein [Phytoactinopolyspora endophytica]